MKITDSAKNKLMTLISENSSTGIRIYLAGMG